MSADLAALIADLQPFAYALVDLAGRAGVQPRVTSTLRSHSQQQRLYDQFLRGETQYPVAPPGLSSHEYGFAFDMVASSREDLHDLGTVWRQWGGVWSPNDEVHFEFPGFNPRSIAKREVQPRGNALTDLCDLASSFVPGLGQLELGEAIAQWIDPIPPEKDTLEARVSRFLQGPCTAILGR